jgi:hypothetical protein
MWLMVLRVRAVVFCIFDLGFFVAVRAMPTAVAAILPAITPDAIFIPLFDIALFCISLLLFYKKFTVGVVFVFLSKNMQKIKIWWI